MKIERVSTGIQGLDEILGGGLPKGHAFLLQGAAGSGKTTMAFQFLMAGAARGEKAMYISILQTREEIDAMAISHGWDLDGIELVVLNAQALEEARLNEQTLLPSHEVQLDEVINGVKEAVERVKPSIVVFDSIEQFRIIAVNSLIYHNKSAILLRLFEKNRSTAIFIHTTEEQAGFKTIAHGVISMDAELPRIGALRRYIRVEKMRSISFHEGRHSYRIRQGGVVVFPPLPVKQEGLEPIEEEVVASGHREIDTMLGGGLARGTSCLLAGASGTGKSTIASVYAHAAAGRGEHVSIFVFDERANTFLERSRGVNKDLAPLVESGLIDIEQINIGDISAGELAHKLRRSVEEYDTRMVIIDSVSGFFNSMGGEPRLLAHLHEMLSYLSQNKVLSFLVLSEHGLFSENSGDIDVSYIADSVIMLRRFESMGGIRLAVSVIKKRIGGHENFIRELQITGDGIKVGEPLNQFAAVLSGHPQYTGKEEKLLD